MHSLDIIGLGALSIDNIHAVEGLSSESGYRIKSSTISASGSAINTVYALNKLGMKCSAIGVTGNDKTGLNMTDELTEAGIDTAHIRHLDRSATDFSMTFCRSNKKPVHFMCRSAGKKWRISDDVSSKLGAASMVYVSGLTDKTQLGATIRAIEHSKSKFELSLSISDYESTMGLQCYEPLIRRAEIIFTSKYAIERLTGKNYRDSVEILRKVGAKTVVIFLCCGEAHKKIKKKGMAAAVTTYICNNEYECLIESAIRKWPNIVENTGAQDAFGHLKFMPIDRCGFLGDIMAQFCLKQSGARNSIPDANELAFRYFQIHHEEISL